jgi:hypothetical protein
VDSAAQAGMSGSPDDGCGGRSASPSLAFASSSKIDVANRNSVFSWGQVAICTFYDRLLQSAAGRDRRREMAADNTLMFTGTRWQTARVVHVGSTLVARSDGGRIVRGSTLVEVAASGHGRKWETDVSLGFWRDFTELSLDDVDGIVAFIRRYGDPDGVLDRGETTHTGAWKNLKALLGTAASAWEPAGPDGVSPVAADPQRFKLAEAFLRDNPTGVLKDVEPMLDPHGPRIVVRARTLATFMCLSALSAVARRVPMRRCEHCGSWLELNRKDSRFCSGSCRSLHAQQLA